MNAQRSPIPAATLDQKSRDAVAAAMNLPASVEADELMEAAAIAKLCSCSQRQVYRMQAAGLMPRSVRLGTMCRWRRSEILRWIADGCPPASGAKGGGR